MAPGCFSAGVLIAAAGWAFHQFLSVSRRHLAALHSVLSPRDRIGSSLCENSARYKRTLNFEACGRAESKKSENPSSGGHYDQIKSSFRTAWTHLGSRWGIAAVERSLICAGGAKSNRRLLPPSTTLPMQCFYALILRRSNSWLGKGNLRVSLGPGWKRPKLPELRAGLDRLYFCTHAAWRPLCF